MDDAPDFQEWLLGSRLVVRVVLSNESARVRYIRKPTNIVNATDTLNLADILRECPPNSG